VVSKLWNSSTLCYSVSHAVRCREERAGTKNDGIHLVVGTSHPIELMRQWRMCDLHNFKVAGRARRQVRCTKSRDSIKSPQVSDWIRGTDRLMNKRSG
jgi:hypothetical protein